MPARTCEPLPSVLKRFKHWYYETLQMLTGMNVCCGRELWDNIVRHRSDYLTFIAPSYRLSSQPSVWKQKIFRWALSASLFLARTGKFTSLDIPAILRSEERFLVMTSERFCTVTVQPFFWRYLSKIPSSGWFWKMQMRFGRCTAAVSDSRCHFASCCEGQNRENGPIVQQSLMMCTE